MNRSERMAIKEQMERIEALTNKALGQVAGMIEDVDKLKSILSELQQKRGPGRPPKDNGLSDGRRETT